MSDPVELQATIDAMRQELELLRGVLRRHPNLWLELPPEFRRDTIPAPACDVCVASEVYP